MIHVGRSIVNGHLELELPDINQNSRKSIVVNGVEIIVMVEDIFMCKNNSVVVIPNFNDGILFNHMIDLNTNPPDKPSIDDCLKNEKIYTIPSYIDGIKTFVLYRYDRGNHRWESDLEVIGGLCQSGDTLVLPTLGVNNGINYHEVASRLLYGLIGCLESPQSELHKLHRIIVTTLYNPDQNNSSMRVIKHLFNLMLIHEQSRQDLDCVICMSQKRNVIFNCGHRITCSRCVKDIMNSSSHMCPICKQVITSIYPCHTVIDFSDKKCACSCKCDDKSNKSGKVLIPCGHYNVFCTACEQHCSDGKCPICSEEVTAMVKLYQ